MKNDLKKMTSDYNDRKKGLENALLAMSHGDNFERQKAIEYLEGQPTKKTVALILPLLREKNTPTRMAAVEVLKKIGCADIEAISELLKDSNEDIRVYTCEILASMKDPGAIPYLIATLENGSENVKNAAVLALGEFNDERAVHALLDMLQDDQWIVFSAICSLGKTKHPAATAPLFKIFCNSDEELSLAACEVLIGYEDNDLLDRIFNTIKGWSKKKRKRYLEVIIQQGNENLFLRLKQSIGRDLFEHLLACVTFDRGALIPILKLMIHFKSKETCDILLETLAEMDPDKPEYSEVLQLFVSLSQIWKSNITEYLSKGDETALAIIKACAEKKTSIREDVLVTSFLKSSTTVKREIVKNASVIVQGNCHDILKEAVRDSDGYVQSFAVNAIGAMKLKKLESELIDLSKAGFMDVRINAIKTLINLNNDEAKRLLEQFVKSGSSDDKKVYLAVAINITGDENFPLVQELFNSKDDDIKKTIVSVIGNFIIDERYNAIFQTLLHAENIPHEVLKIIKEKKLAQFKPILNKIVFNSRRSLWTRYYALLALGALGDPLLFEFFVKGLNDENNLIKIGSLKALCDLRDKKAVVFVEPLTKHHNDDVRSTAEFVMSRLHDS